jgi:hypothetical protein
VAASALVGFSVEIHNSLQVSAVILLGNATPVESDRVYV